MIKIFFKISKQYYLFKFCFLNFKIYYYYNYIDKNNINEELLYFRSK